MLERKFDATQARIRAVNATREGTRLKVAVVCDENNFRTFKCGDVIEKIAVPGVGILTGVVCGIGRKREADGGESYSFEFLAQHCQIEPPMLPDAGT